MRAIAMAALFAVAVPFSANAATESECQAQWMAADTNSDGFVTEAEGARFHATLRANGKAVADGKLGRDAFLRDCKADVFAMKAPEPGAPIKGANSFTEQQARDRAVAHGLSDVAALKKDGDGIWRATAKHNGKAVNVAIDFKGNVVVN